MLAEIYTKSIHLFHQYFMYYLGLQKNKLDTLSIS